MNSPDSGRWAERSRFGLLLALILACVLWGGGSRLDIPGLILLQPLAIVVAAALVIVPGEIRWAAIRTPLMLLAALAIVMMVQLIPLPPTLWTALPGHGQLLPFLQVTGHTESWRPLSLTPDLTLASLVGLGVPAAALIGFASLPEDKTHRLLGCLLIVGGLSVLLGLGQLAGGPQSGFYRYAVTNAGAAVGLFSNRNHQAFFLAMIWPMLALWATRRGLDAQQRSVRRWVGWAGAVALIPMVTVTGSRAGLVLALIGMGLALWLLRANASRSPDPSRSSGWLRRAAPALTAFGVLAMGALTIFLSRGEAIQRLLTTSLAEESRFSFLPVLLRMAGDFFPFGSGFGSFDPVFRFYEPKELLDPTYLNHAHNDLIELVITGGLPALAVALAFLAWAIRRALALRVGLAGSEGERFAFLGAAMILLLLLASLADYPLRTPIHAVLFALASGWLAAPRRLRSRAEKS